MNERNFEHPPGIIVKEQHWSEKAFAGVLGAAALAIMLSVASVIGAIINHTVRATVSDGDTTIVNLPAPEGARAAVEPQLSQPLAQLDQWEVACSDSTPTSLTVDSGGGTHSVSSVLLINGSSTCVQIGGSTVTSSTGAPIGTGATCYASATLAIDARGGYCLSTSGTVTIDVVGGKL